MKVVEIEEDSLQGTVLTAGGEITVWPDKYPSKTIEEPEPCADLCEPQKPTAQKPAYTEELTEEDHQTSETLSRRNEQRQLAYHTEKYKGWFHRLKKLYQTNIGTFGRNLY